jgi:hypothetical protein
MRQPQRRPETLGLVPVADAGGRMARAGRPADAPTRQNGASASGLMGVCHGARIRDAQRAAAITALPLAVRAHGALLPCASPHLQRFVDRGDALAAANAQRRGAKAQMVAPQLVDQR